ncbi:MAG: hypothetical protein KGL39_27810 [Patescibacteria group bacterium]|nr:hypothetical protein [Patescibacteria group bacterium]
MRAEVDEDVWKALRAIERLPSYSRWHAREQSNLLGAIWKAISTFGGAKSRAADGWQDTGEEMAAV